MQAIDNEFFDEYKKLDKICGEIFNCTNGVSEYISQMDMTGGRKYKISTWNEDYRELIHLRSVRNDLAHNTYDYAISNQNDLEMVKKFYERIINQEDPFAQLRKLDENERKITKNKASTVQTKPVSNNKMLYEKISFAIDDIEDRDSRKNMKSSDRLSVLSKILIALGIIFVIGIIIMLL